MQATAPPESELNYASLVFSAKPALPERTLRNNNSEQRRLRASLYPALPSGSRTPRYDKQTQTDPPLEQGMSTKKWLIISLVSAVCLGTLINVAVWVFFTNKETKTDSCLQNQEDLNAVSPGFIGSDLCRNLPYKKTLSSFKSYQSGTVITLQGYMSFIGVEVYHCKRPHLHYNRDPMWLDIPGFVCEVYAWNEVVRFCCTSDSLRSPQNIIIHHKTQPCKVVLSTDH